MKIGTLITHPFRPLLMVDMDRKDQDQYIGTKYSIIGSLLYKIDGGGGSPAYPGGAKEARAPRGSTAKTVKSACFGANFYLISSFSTP